MIEQASLIIGDGNWAVKSDSLLGYALPQGKYTPREMTFTRATTGTRVNAAGLVEVVPYNFALWSEQFENAEWVTTGVVVSSNVEISPSGKLNADKLAPLSGNAIRSSNLIPISNNTTYTWSVYVKNAGARYVNFTAWTSDDPITVYDLDLVLVVYESGPAHTSTIQDVGNGWRRITITRTSTSTSAWVLLRLLATPATPPTNGIDGTYVWGAQLVEGTQPLTYLPTTTRLNIPRIDYSTGSATLLVETQRTNLALRSEDFNNGSWTKSGATVTSDSIVSPSGIQNADTITQSGGTLNINQTITISSVGNYTYTVYLKKGNFDSSTLFRFGAFQGGDLGYIIFDFNTNTTSVISGTIISHSSTSVGNGWYRIQYTINIPAIGAVLFYNGGVGGSIGVGNFFYSWGAQLEAGPCATSYIPTTSASVTRNADAFTRTNFQASGLLTATKNTFFFDINAIGATGSNYHFFKFTATSGFDISVWRFVGNQNWNIQLNGVFINTGVSNGKFAVVQDGSQTKFFINGVLNTTTGATGTINSIDSFIGLYQLASPSFIKALAIYPEVLTDAECIALTTP